jgi:MSHA biogenesis protein MshM
MYKKHFRLNKLPFTITPDTGFFFAHASHQEALNMLLVAVRSGEGFMKVVGEVGTGKTILCRKFLNALEEDHFVTAYIPNPYIGPQTLLLGVADELGIEYPTRVNQHQLLKLLTHFLIDKAREGRHAILCLDEAQAMPVQTMEALRLFTNLETESRKLLQVVLFGQPELNTKLNNRSIRQLKQRITFSYNLRPFNEEDVDYYLAHRLSIAGYRGPRLFTPRAVVRTYKASRGIPRLINIIAHKALMAGFGEGVRQVSERHVRLAVDDTESIKTSVRIKEKIIGVLSSLSAAIVLGVALSLSYGLMG